MNITIYRCSKLNIEDWLSNYRMAKASNYTNGLYKNLEQEFIKHIAMNNVECCFKDFTLIQYTSSQQDKHILERTISRGASSIGNPLLPIIKSSDFSALLNSEPDVRKVVESSEMILQFEVPEEKICEGKSGTSKKEGEYLFIDDSQCILDFCTGVKTKSMTDFKKVPASDIKECFKGNSKECQSKFIKLTS